MKTQEVATHRVLTAIDAIKSGRMVIMVDDEDRENEGDLVFAAQHVCPEKINFMTKEARGLICLSLDQASVDRLRLPMMEDSSKRGGVKSTAFTVSIEAREGVTTGISAADRSHTIKVACDAKSGPDDIVVPGHIFPLKARAGGVLQRAGHTEGSVDIARLAGLDPAAVICEIMNDDGTMARRSDLETFSKKHNIPIVSIAELITFRLHRESLVEELRAGTIQTAYGEFKALLFRSLVDDQTHIAVIKGEPTAADIVDVRVHRQHMLLDVLDHRGDSARSRVEYGLQMLSNVQLGVLLYMTHSEEQPDLTSEFDTLTKRAPSTESRAGKPWVETDTRMLGVGAQILRHIGVKRMRVHMANPTPLKGLAGFELEVVDMVEIKAPTLS